MQPSQNAIDSNINQNFDIAKDVSKSQHIKAQITIEEWSRALYEEDLNSKTLEARLEKVVLEEGDDENPIH